jgi:hypothetical protein
MVDAKHYAYRVVWSEEDQEFIGLCAEFPSLSHLDEDQVSALKGIVALVADVISDMEDSGETPPSRSRTGTTPDVSKFAPLRNCTADSPSARQRPT